MPTLTESQIKKGYFSDIGGFPPAEIVHEVKEYRGETHLCIACTQLNGEEVKVIYPNAKGYSEREKKRILAEWIEFLQTNTKAFTALHFNSRVPQKLFDAACCQENLEELRFKWGAYSDLTAIKRLKRLKFLYIGSGASVKELGELTALKNLIVLYLENFKRIDDYSPLTALDKLEQLVISGPILGSTPIKDLEFLRLMRNLGSIWTPNTTIIRRYTDEERFNLCASLPNLYGINDCI